MIRLRQLMVIHVVALAGGCASAAGPGVDPRVGDPVEVEVQNRGTYEVIVYARYGGQSHRLGEVAPLGDGRLSLPPAIPVGVRVRFQVRTIGPSTGFESQEFFLDAGDVVLIRVQPNIRQTTVSIRS